MRDPQAERQRQQKTQQALIRLALQPPDDRDQDEEADVEQDRNADEKRRQQDRERRVLLSEGIDQPPCDQFRRSRRFEHSAQHRAEREQQEDVAQNVRNALMDGVDDRRRRQPGGEAQAETDDEQRDERMDVVADDDHEQRDERRCRTDAGPMIVHRGFV